MIIIARSNDTIFTSVCLIASAIFQLQISILHCYHISTRHIKPDDIFTSIQLFNHLRYFDNNTGYGFRLFQSTWVDNL